MIKSLPKTFEMKGKQVPFFHCENWVTNAEFAIKRDTLQDSYRYCLNKPNFEHPSITRIVPEDINGMLRVEMTNKLYDMGDKYGRVFLDKYDSEYIVAEKYVKHFSLKVLYTKGEGYVMCDENITFVVMPMRSHQKMERVA